MPRVDAISLPNLPIGLILPKDRPTTYEDVDKFLEKNPTPIQRLTYLTLGGAFLSILGAVVGLSSKAQSLFGSLLVLVGLGITGAGYYKSPCTTIGVSNVQDDNVTKSEKKQVKKEKSTPNAKDINGKISNEDLINILLNKDTDKKYTAKKRAEVAIELGKRRVEEAVKPLKDCLTDKFKRVQEACINALGKIGNNKTFEILREFVKDKSLKTDLRLKAVNAMREILRTNQ